MLVFSKTEMCGTEYKNCMAFITVLLTSGGRQLEVLTISAAENPEQGFYLIPAPYLG